MSEDPLSIPDHAPEHNKTWHEEKRKKTPLLLLTKKLSSDSQWRLLWVNLLFASSYKRCNLSICIYKVSFTNIHYDIKDLVKVKYYGNISNLLERPLATAIKCEVESSGPTISLSTRIWWYPSILVVWVYHCISGIKPSDVTRK